MKKYFNAENGVLLVIVVLGVIVAGFVGPYIARAVNKAKPSN